MLSIWSPWFIDFARSLTVLINCFSQDQCFLKPCYRSVSMLLFSKCFMILLCNACSKTLHEMNVKLTGLYFSALLRFFSPHLNNGDVRASFHASGISFWVREALNNSVIASVISFDVFFSILAGIPSGPIAFYTFKSSRSFFTTSFNIIISSISDARGNLVSGVFWLSIEKTLLNWWFRIRGLSLSAIFIVLFSRRSNILTMNLKNCI